MTDATQPAVPPRRRAWVPPEVARIGGGTAEGGLLPTGPEGIAKGS